MIVRNHNKDIIYESNQIKGEGCCFSSVASQQREPYLMNPSRIRVYSQPKESKSRKIGLVTPKKGVSHGKETTNTSGNLSHEKIVPQYHQKMGIPKSAVTFNYCSKVTTQKNSLKSSKIALNSNIKQNRMSNQKYQQRIPPCNKIQVSVQNRESEPSTARLLGIDYISEISLVSEEFISQGSATNIVNLINQQKINANGNDVNTHRSSQPETLKKYIYSNCFEQKERKNPVERIMDRKRYELKAQNRKKRIVT